MTENELRRLILKRLDLSAGAKIALLGVMLRIDWATWSGECSVTEVMNLTALSRSGVNRAFIQLKDAGIIERSHTQRGPRADRAKMRVNIEALQDPVHNVNSSQKNKLTVHNVNSSQKTPIHKRDTNGTQKNKLTVHNVDTNRTHYRENQPSSTNNNLNQPTRTARIGCFKPSSIMPQDRIDEKRRRGEALTQAWRLSGLPASMRMVWVDWWMQWKEENYPDWSEMNWPKYETDIKAALPTLNEKQNNRKVSPAPSW